jgi:hypothetical protein
MTAAKQPLVATASTARSTLAVASFLQGLPAIVLWTMALYAGVRAHQPQWIPCLVAGALGLGAVVCGVLALREIRRCPALRGRELAIAGIVLGGIPLAMLI